MKEIEMTEQDLRARTNQIMCELPEPNYHQNFQPTYQNQAALAEAIFELQNTRPVTTIHEINDLRARLRSYVPLVILGNCAEPIDLQAPIESFVTNSLANMRTIALSALRQCVLVERSRGQNTKPRSNETETIDGIEVISYMGDAVNGREAHLRSPEPTRLVAAAIQARDIEEGIRHKTGLHLPAAHEALHIAYEKSFKRTDSKSGKSYILSGDLLWAGLRTNDPDGLHVELLTDVENTVGAKLGPDTTADKIARLVEKLNPKRELGKLIYMLRFGIKNQDSLLETLESIHQHDPEGRVIYDMHGSTRTVDGGVKLRVVEEIIEEISVVANACKSAGLRLGGLHLETMTNNAQLQCVDTADQRPTHPGNVDPQLNPRQTLTVLNASAPYLL